MLLLCGSESHERRVLTGGNGAGIAISTAVDPIAGQCGGVDGKPVTYWSYQHNISIVLHNVSCIDNAAALPSSSGGGLFASSGGLISIQESLFIGNAAGLYGGGVALGVGEDSATCGLVLADSVFSENIAVHGGSQLYMGCEADVLVTSTNVSFGVGDSEVGVAHGVLV